MANLIKCKLSKDSIGLTKRYVESLKRNLEESKSKVNEEISKKLTMHIQQYHGEFVSELKEIDDPQNHNVTYDYKVLRNSAKVIVSGPQVVYDEFGTGENGLMDPHPNKSNYPELSDYNSGPNIEVDSDGNHYWIFNDNKTYGVPAGMFVFRAIRDMQDGEAKSIAKDIIVKDTLNIANRGE